MVKRKIIYVIVASLLIFASILGARIIFEKNQKLEINFLDVGQGDAILISRGDNQILIDGGPSGEVVLEKLGKIIPFWDRKIEVVIATHPDADHISGLVDVLERYETDLILESGIESDSQVFQKLKEIISHNNFRRELGREGMKVRIGEEAELEILSPFVDFQGGKSKDTNSNGIVSKLTFGKNKFLLMADVPEEKEREIMEKGKNIEAQILKVGHHGSKNSSGQDFLKKVGAKDAVISVGKTNRYGHPSQEALDRLQAEKMNIFRTDEMGDIVFVCQNSEEDCELQ